MYILEGNIGAGKSTFLKLITEHLPHINVAQEPVNNWQSHVHGQSLLANFYQKPQRWAFSMEVFAMICRVKEHLKDQQNYNPHRIIERSIYSGHYCFSLNGYENGFMTNLEWALYNEWFNFLITNKCKPPLGFIYLQTDPELAYKRLKKRNRLAEKKISLHYLKQIHYHHEQFLLNQNSIVDELKKVPVLVLDCNQEFEENEQLFKQHADKVITFMENNAQKSITPTTEEKSITA